MGNLPSLTGFGSYLILIIESVAELALPRGRSRGLAVTPEEKERPCGSDGSMGRQQGRTLAVLTCGSTADAAKSKATFLYTILLL